MGLAPLTWELQRESVGVIGVPRDVVEGQGSASKVHIQQLGSVEGAVYDDLCRDGINSIHGFEHIH